MQWAAGCDHGWGCAGSRVMLPGGKWDSKKQESMGVLVDQQRKVLMQPHRQLHGVEGLIGGHAQPLGMQ